MWCSVIDFFLISKVTGDIWSQWSAWSSICPCACKYPATDCSSWNWVLVARRRRSSATILLLLSRQLFHQAVLLCLLSLPKRLRSGLQQWGEEAANTLMKWLLDRWVAAEERRRSSSYCQWAGEICDLGPTFKGDVAWVSSSHQTQKLVGISLTELISALHLRSLVLLSGQLKTNQKTVQSPSFEGNAPKDLI